MSPTQNRRIRKLIRVLEGLPPRQCHMGEWARVTGDRPFAPRETRGTPGCGTTACLAGWAGLVFAPTARYSKVAWGGTFYVPEAWAHRVGLMEDTTFKRLNAGEEVLEGGGSWIPVRADDLGEWALGEEVSMLFYNVPSEDPEWDGSDYDHRGWMIWKLRQVLAAQPA